MIENGALVEWYGMLKCLGLDCRTFGTPAQNGTQKDFLGTRHSPLSHFFFYFLYPTSVSILWKMYMCVCAHTHTHNTHTSDCLEPVYELPMLPNKVATVIFLHKSWVVQSVDWIFIIGAPAGRCLGENVTLDNTFIIFSSVRKEWQPSYCHSLFRITFLEEAFIWYVKIIHCINYIIIKVKR